MSNRLQNSTAIKRLMGEVQRELHLHQAGKHDASYVDLKLQFRQLERANEEDMFVAGPISEENFLEWEAYIKGPEDTPFEGGIFVAKLTFPRDYPMNPPKMRFDPPLLHPNIYADGNVCISILHSPGDDPNMYESSSERWSPVQNVQSILLSVVSMLAEPNIESGANIDVCKMYRDNKSLYERTIRNFVRQQLGLPEQSA